MNRQAVVMEDTLDDELLEIQHWMQNALRYPGKVDDAIVNREVKGSTSLSSREALGVYQRSYYARLLTCMREQFPALCYALGESVFNCFAIEYLRELPSDSYTLYELGRRFPSYIRDTRPDRHLDEKELWIEFMVELVAFERKVFTLFDAPGDEDNLIFSSDVSDDNLILQRCFCLHKSHFPVASYYCLVRDSRQPGLPPLEDAYVVMVRSHYNTRLLPITPVQYRFLEMLQHTASIDMALDVMPPSLSVRELWEAPEGWRKQWLAAGFFKMKSD